MNELLIIAFCIFLNAILAAVEMAFVTVTKPRLRELARSGHKDARRILSLREKPERTLSVIQIGITVVGAIAAAVGGASSAHTIGPWIQRAFGLSANVAEGAAVVAVVLPLTYFNVLLGELVPKTLALRNSLTITLWAARGLIFFDRFLSPFVSVLEISTRVVLRLLRPRTRILANAPTEESESVELDQLSRQTREYVLNIVDLEKKRIRDLKLPWNEVIYVRAGQPAAEVERIVLESGHTRLPVVDSSDAVLGIMNTKEFMVWRAAGQSDWSGLVRPVVKVEESSPIFRALKRMQDSRSHLSITYSNGRRTGIVTMEDIFEEVIGDVFDEDDDGVLRRILSTVPRFRSIPRSYPQPHK